MSRPPKDVPDRSNPSHAGPGYPGLLITEVLTDFPKQDGPELSREAPAILDRMAIRNRRTGHAFLRSTEFLALLEEIPQDML
jgi:hypothetical protein